MLGVALALVGASGASVASVGSSAVSSEISTADASRSSCGDSSCERVRRLIAAKRMTKAGLASISHVFDHKRDTKRKASAKIPADIVRALKRDPAAWKNFQRFPESYKRIRIGWIVAARHRRAVLLQRLRYFIKMTAQNKRFGMVQ